MTLQRLAKHPLHHRQRHLVLLDKFAVCSAFTECRDDKVHLTHHVHTWWVVSVNCVDECVLLLCRSLILFESFGGKKGGRGGRGGRVLCAEENTSWIMH